MTDRTPFCASPPSEAHWPGNAGEIWTPFGAILVDATDEIVLLVGHNPRTVSAAAIPRRRVPEVQGFHGAVVVIAAVDLRIAVVEAAAGVEMLAIDDPVLPLRLVVDRGAFHIVLAKSHAWFDEHAVDLVPHDANWRHVGDGKVVEASQGWAAESATGSLCKVIVLGGLIVDNADPAIGSGAEFILCGCVGVSTRIRNWRAGWLDNPNVQGLAIRLA
jgi:hypothetical protein